MIEEKYIYECNGQKQYDYCSSCERPIMQEDLGGGVFGCEFCKSPCHIEVIDVDNWNDNSIQFPRLIAEINANVSIGKHDWADLCMSMDLSSKEVIELFDRADKEWERIKGN